MELSRHYESRRNRRWLTLVLAALLAGGTAFAVYDGLTSGSAASAVPKPNGPATVETIGKGGLKRVVLVPSAAERLGIETAPVEHVLVNGARRMVIPYEAVLYDTNGETWTYTSPKRLVYVRRRIQVDEIDGNRAVLSKGPRPGTVVVTVGSAELWGVEYGEIEED